MCSSRDLRVCTAAHKATLALKKAKLKELITAPVTAKNKTKKQPSVVKTAKKSL